MHNLNEIKALAGPNAFMCPMIKANAYGHGATIVAKKLEHVGVEHLGVALVEEGVELREQGIENHILIFGPFDRDAAQVVLSHQLTPVVSTWRQLQALEDVLEGPIDIHLKFDTGMHRLGFDIEDAPKLFENLKSHKKLKLRGVLTHLHSGEDFTDLRGQSFEQLKSLQLAFEVFKPLGIPVHSLNSAGLLTFYRYSKNELPAGIEARQGVRPGLSLYGVSPVPTNVSFKPVMSLRSSIAKLQKIRKGDGVSYGLTWKAKRDSVIALLPIGYADGYHRRLSNKAEVLFKGHRVPQVGNVCMDYTMIDVTDVVGTQSLDSFWDEEVTLFGSDSDGHVLSAMELAKWSGTIPWEILTSVSNRVPRLIVE